MTDPSTSDSAPDSVAETKEDSQTQNSVDPQSIEGIFLQALQLDSHDERVALLDTSCEGDEARRQRVLALLRAYDDAGSFMNTPACGSAAGTSPKLNFLTPDEHPDLLGTIGGYEASEVIGQGGMGIVLQARDPRLNRVVAIKVLMPEVAANPSAQHRFLREAQAAAAVSHPHVVTIHAVEEAAVVDGRAVPPWLVMECVVGQSLQQKLEASGALGVREILRVSRQIAEGLAAAHRQGVIHRDIKPANILLENGVERVKITDFGLARVIDDITVTRTGEVSGTPQYMSPEQAEGQRVDHRSDLFSLGCVIYAMCTGHSPFRGDSIAHVIKRVTQDSPRSIAEQNPDIPPWLIEIINCLLQKNPEHRFESAEGLVAVLDQHLARYQQPLSPDSHSMINAAIPHSPAGEESSPSEVRTQATAVPQLPVAARVQSSDTQTTSPVASPSEAQAAYNGEVVLPTWARTLGRGVAFCYVACLLYLLYLLGLPYSQRSADETEFAVIFVVVGIGPLVMSIFLQQVSLRREVLLIALFCGLGPVGLLLYLWIVKTASSHGIQQPAEDRQSHNGITAGSDDKQNPVPSAVKRVVNLLIIAAVTCLLVSPVIYILALSTVPHVAETMMFLIWLIVPIALLAIIVGGLLRIVGGGPVKLPGTNRSLATGAVVVVLILLNAAVWHQVDEDAVGIGRWLLLDFSRTDSAVASAVVGTAVMDSVPTGQFRIDIRDAGLAVRIYEVDEDGAFKPGSPCWQGSTIQSHDVDLPAGKYRIHIHDLAFGWETSYDARRVTLHDGSQRALTVQRDETRLSQTHSADTFVWNWNSRFRAENEHQVEVFNALLENPTQTFSERDVLAQVEKYLARRPNYEGLFGDSILDVFGPLPDFIQFDETNRTLRLLPMQVVEVGVSVEAPGLSTVLRVVDDRFEIPEIILPEGTHQLQLPPAEAHVDVTDRFTSWLARANGLSAPTNLTSRRILVLSEEGDVEAVHISRDLPGLADCDLNGPSDSPNVTVFLRWPVVGGPETFEFSLPQAKCVQELIRGLTNGQPDVSEEELGPLQTEWERLAKLIVPGDSPATRRIVPPIIPGADENPSAEKPESIP